MLKAATALKVSYSNSIYSTCMAHGLERVAEGVRAKPLQLNLLTSVTTEIVERNLHVALAWGTLAPRTSVNKTENLDRSSQSLQ
jgi:hypothetical protein